MMMYWSWDLLFQDKHSKPKVRLRLCKSLWLRSQIQLIRRTARQERAGTTDLTVELSFTRALE